ncbi:AraC family transcriptional regulator [Rhizobium leguminosarum]|uniref:AraC family transcriptional regulator n=1 Tax=Rhizobium leguminosarum TaxID=384 RepID=UPI001C911508|nr:AraC family transcriptional regulator [Rhizobium leguminosarum]MBY2907708.1 AraC family transcriptional regulator [Rhizobium leguminosarum]
MDILLGVIQLLRPRAILFGGGLDAFGEWGLSFRKRDDLLFCWIEQGECQLIRPQQACLHMKKGDFLLIRTSTPFTLTSGGFVEPVDSETVVSSSKRKRLYLGSGKDNPVILHAGKFVVDAANEDLLASLLPQLIHIVGSDPSQGRLRTLLDLNEKEAREPRPAGEFVVGRLVELIFVEILRSQHSLGSMENKGLIAGLADSVTEPALVAMHRDFVRNWSVADLAKLGGVSRSTFATRFRRVVGTGPIEYLLNWRIALAKHELMAGTKSVSEVAFQVGFQSSSAFSSAFTREVGTPPTQFARGQMFREENDPHSLGGRAMSTHR